MTVRECLLSCGFVKARVIETCQLYQYLNHSAVQHDFCMDWNRYHQIIERFKRFRVMEIWSVHAWRIIQAINK